MTIFLEKSPKTAAETLSDPLIRAQNAWRALAEAMNELTPDCAGGWRIYGGPDFVNATCLNVFEGPAGSRSPLPGTMIEFSRNRHMDLGN